eukprot:gene22547-23739_t
MASRLVALDWYHAVTFIGQGAFHYDQQLRSVTLPSSLGNISAYTFAN